MEIENLKFFNTLLNEYPVLFIDTCTLIAPIWYNMKSHTDWEFEKKILENELFREKLFAALNNKSIIYLNSAIEGEYITKNNFNFSEQIKKISRANIPNSKRKNLIRLIRLRKRTKNERVTLIELFNEKNKVLNLKKVAPKLYSQFEERYLKIGNKYKLSSPDFNLIFSSFVLRRKYGSSAILSNDSKIARAEKEILAKEGVSYRNFGVFIREKRDLFRRM